MKALPRSEMNRRSPRVVSMARMPRRGAPPGESSSQAVIATSMSATEMKKAAVSHVQAIHERPCAVSMVVPLRRVGWVERSADPTPHPIGLLGLAAARSNLHPAQGEALGDVVAHEID